MIAGDGQRERSRRGVIAHCICRSSGLLRVPPVVWLQPWGTGIVSIRSTPVDPLLGQLTSLEDCLRFDHICLRSYLGRAKRRANRLKHYFFTRDDEASARGIALDVPGWRKAAGVTSESKSSITAATVENRAALSSGNLGLCDAA